MNKGIILASAVGLLATGASAFPLMTYLGHEDGRQVRMSLNSGSSFSTVFAGELRLKLETAPSIDEIVVGYCADPRTNMSGSAWGLTITDSSVIPSVGARLGHIVNSYAPALLANGDDDGAMALQVAIWEILVETSATYDVTDGLFRAKKSDGNAFDAGELALINGILNDNGSGTAKYYQSALNGAGNPKSQSILAPVPEPATIGVLAVGAAALLRKRRSR